ncbi:MAG: hypothetical protein NC411_02855 [Bacteroides sp.]|nr:hypothetical protein [Bacteroides sp.]
MSRRKFRVKNGVAFEDGHVFPCYKVQMRILGFLWITIKEFVEEYPEMLGVHVSAKCDANDLLVQPSAMTY